MKFIKTEIPDLIIIEPEIFGDKRGYFIESYNKKQFVENIGDINFIQDNESKSSYGVLRGMHYQKPPFTQAKLVRCVSGEVLDVVVDMRKNSPTYKASKSILLNEDNKRQVFVPKGFAHGFLVLSESAVFAYKVDQLYAPDSDSGFLWSDVDIDWMLDVQDIILSPKDINQKGFSDSDNPF